MKLPKFATVLVASAAIIASGLIGPVPAHAEGHHDVGRIIWNQYNADFSAMRLVSSAPNGSHFRGVTRFTEGVFDQDAVFSPDGRFVVFIRNDFRQSDEGVGTIGLVRSSGGPVRVLTLGCNDPCFASDLPSWTPDGKRIVFTRVLGPIKSNGEATSAVLYTAKPNGDDLRRLSPPGIDDAYGDFHARFSPDGSYLIFLRGRVSDGHEAVFRMRPDGTDVQRLTPWKLDADLPDLSSAHNGPTKDLVVFETFGHGWVPPETSRVATVPATCTSVAACVGKIHYVTADVKLPNAAFNPVWSPNGRRIAYCAFRDRGPHVNPLAVITTVRFDGRGSRRVSNPSFFSFRPDWTAARSG